MNLYNRTMTAKFAYNFLKKKEYVFLSARPEMAGNIEQRGKQVKENLKPEKYYEIEYFSEGISKEGKIEEGFRVFGRDDIIKEYASLRKNDICSFLGCLASESQNLVIDFTLMNTRFLGAFCAILNMYKWNEIFFCYTEPGTYSKNEHNDFDLKNITMGFDQIPGLETFSDSSTKCDWVIFLGFEGSRLMRLEEESPATRRYSLPYISIPAMKTTWHNIAINTNRHFFEIKVNDQEKIDYVSATNPFETYDKLNNLHSSNSGIRLVISPIGPKPVMLGCIMYVLENENEMLLFDNPFQEGSNTNEYGETHFYDLSQFVRSVKNKRFMDEEEG